MLALIAEHWIIAIVIALALWLLLRNAWNNRIDARFGIKRVGGRGGTITISFPTYLARAEFEIGGKVDLIIYGESFTDIDGNPLPTERQSEAIARLWAWAAARKLSLDISGFLPPYAPAA